MFSKNSIFEIKTFETLSLQCLKKCNIVYISEYICYNVHKLPFQSYFNVLNKSTTISKN